MLKRRDIITAVEIGTSKICVLIGASRPDEPLTIIGRGEASGADCRKAGHSECFVHTNSLVKVGKRCFPLLCQ